MLATWNSYVVKNSIGIHPKSLSNWHNAFRSAENFIKENSLEKIAMDINLLRESAWQITHAISKIQCSLSVNVGDLPIPPMHVDWKLHFHQSEIRKLFCCFCVSSNSNASTVRWSMWYQQKFDMGINLSGDTESMSQLSLPWPAGQADDIYFKLKS